jgi:hypothetical protein
MTTTRKDTASVSAKTQGFKKHRTFLRGDHREFFDARLRSRRLSICGAVSNAVCGILLLAALTLAGRISYQWINHAVDKFFTQPTWHEPLDSWAF